MGDALGLGRVLCWSVAGAWLAPSGSQQRKVARQVAYGHLLEQRVQERTLELQKANEELAKASITDSLTGLANRRFLSELRSQRKFHSFTAAIARSTATASRTESLRHRLHDDRSGQLQVDQRLERSFGRRRGAAPAARHSARVLQGTDIVIRWGGDEFSG